MKWERFAVALAVLALMAGGDEPSSAQQGDRDTPAQATKPPAPEGRISGRVLTADTGRPVRRARVLLRAPELPEGRGALTDENGVFEFEDLPAGRYTVSASKTGFVGLS